MEFKLDLPISNDFFTHLPLLKHIFEKENVIPRGGKVLELGCGDGSSPFFKHVQAEMDLEIFTFENNLEWYQKQKEKHGSEKYTFNYIDNWDEVTPKSFNDEIFDFVFIDQSPWEARIKSAITFKDHARYIAIHDYDYYMRELRDLNEKIEDNFKEKILYYDIHPPTLLISNIESINFNNILWK